MSKIMSKTIHQTTFSTDFPPFKELVQLPFSLISFDGAMSVGKYNADKSKPYKVMDIHVIDIYFPLDSTGGTVEGTMTFKSKETKIVYTIRWYIDYQESTRKIYSASLDGSLSSTTYVATYRV